MNTPVREVTQFSLVEFKAWKASGAALETVRHKFMATFDVAVECASSEAWDGVGGLDNIARVRCFGEPEGSTCRFEYALKLPVSKVAEKRNETKRQEVLAKLEALKSDPAALREFVQKVAYAVLDRVLVISLLEGTKKPASKPAAVAKKKAPARHRVEPIVAKKSDPFQAALQQDKRNRIEAAKKAAAEYHQKAVTK